MKKISTHLSILVLSFIIIQSNAQTIFRSVVTGNWNTAATWEVSTNNGGAYSAATAGPTANQSVIVNTGHTVTLPSGQTGTCLNLTINSGAILTDGGAVRAFRPGTSSSGTSGTIATVTNDGTFGGSSDASLIEIPTTCAQLTITGTGTYTISRIRAITGNTNYPASSVTNHANSCVLIVDRDMTLTAANYCFSGANSTVGATDVFVFTINAGKTVTISNAGGSWHNSGMTTGGTLTGGSYTYNVNGTLDLSATSTATTTFIPYSNAASSIAVNVNGLLKLGANFKADTVNTSAGSIALNINNGGVIDASATTSLQASRVNTTSGNIYFVISGTGVLKRTVAATDVLFPVGTSSTVYNPITLNNSGTSDVFGVNIKNTFDNTVSFTTALVNKQYAISEATAGGSNLTVKLGWLTADQGSTFSPSGTVVIGRWNGTTWDTYPATVSGTGTLADPYIASASGITGVGNFVVANISTLPLSFLNVSADVKAAGVQISWNTSNEINVANYSVEKSIDGRSFTSIATVLAKNNATNSYNVIDPSITGAAYYRIKAIDKDGSYTYSAVVFTVADTKTAAVTVYPNPITNKQVNVQLSNLSKGSYNIEVYNNLGQVILSKAIQFDGGTTSLSLQLPTNLNAGLYRLSVSNGVTKFNKTISVQ